MLKNKSDENPLRTDVETKKIISELAGIMPDKHIVAFLNRIGKTTVKGHTWNPVRLRAFRNNNNIPVYREGERQEREEFTVDEASSKLGIGSIGLPKNRFSTPGDARHHEVKKFGTKDFTNRILSSHPILWAVKATNSTVI